MDNKLLEQRLRQLFAVDKNVLDIYRNLSKMVSDEEMKAKLLFLAADEEKHVKLEEEMFSFLERSSDISHNK